MEEGSSFPAPAFIGKGTGILEKSMVKYIVIVYRR